MSVCLVYDDRANVSDDILSLLGVSKFSAVLYRKRTLLDHLRGLMRDVGVPDFLHLTRAGDTELLAAHMDRAPGGQRYLYYPSHVVPKRLDAARLFLKKIQYSRRDLIIPVQTDPPGAPVLFVGEPAMRELLEPVSRMEWGRLARAGGRALATIRNSADLLDISRYDRFVEFLSGNFDARHFNTIEHDGLTVRKRSADKEKIRREYTFLSMVEGPLQPFFLRPFDLREEQGEASYRMERLNVPDMAIQWIHGALSEAEFEVFLERIDYFLRLRPLKSVDQKTFDAVTGEMYSGKVRSRLEQLKAAPGGEQIAALVERCTPYGSLEALSSRWHALEERLGRKRGPAALAFTHGDLCFSNILYDKRIRQIKFIDPRGADTPEQMFSHPYYDAAKLSHSVLGGYDFLNQNLFELCFAGDLRLRLEPAEPDLSAHKGRFVECMEGLGFDAELMRLYEASLFLSMLPLHTDVPKKALAFAINAGMILDELEGGHR